MQDVFMYASRLHDTYLGTRRTYTYHAHRICKTYLCTRRVYTFSDFTWAGTQGL